MEELTIIEQLSQLRITASSQIPPHEFLYTWNGTPCFAKGELVAVTGKAKSGKTYLNSLLMAAASGQTFIGLKSLRDQETSHSFGIFGTVANGLLAVLWIGLYLAGIN